MTPSPLCLAAILHTPDLVAALARAVPSCKVSREWHPSNGTVTIALVCDFESDQFFEDERRALSAALGTMRSAGFHAEAVRAKGKPCVRLSGYFGAMVEPGKGEAVVAEAEAPSLAGAPFLKPVYAPAPAASPSLPPGCYSAPANTFGREYVEHWLKGTADRRVRQLRRAGLTVSTRTITSRKRLWTEGGVSVVLTEVAYLLPAGMSAPPQMVAGEEKKAA